MPSLNSPGRLRSSWLCAVPIAIALHTLPSYSQSSQTPGFTTIQGARFSVNACANEGPNACFFQGSRKVAYGARGKFVVKTFESAAFCDNRSFGQDPIQGVVKQCFLEQPPTTSTGTPSKPSSGGWTKVASEGQTFSVSGTKTVRYGKDSSWVQRSVAGGGSCTNGYFGKDPRFGVVKQCEVQATTASAPAPAPAPAPSPATTPALPSSLPPAPTAPSGSAATFPAAKLDAARLLTQATYGPTLGEIDAVARMGAPAWLEQQFKQPSIDRHWDYIARKGPPGCKKCNSQYMNGMMESFWLQALRGPDQLRQRTVLALSEIFVVSAVNSSIPIQAEAHASYLDMLSRNAFGNFRTLLEEVATHPTMAVYLSHMANEKEDPDTGRIPDENFARELMQLFTVGLWQLNEDGSRKKDGQGADIPVYGQDDVMGLAKVFTGWSWAGPDKSYDRWKGWKGANWRSQLQNYPDFHSKSEKRFLRAVVPAGATGEQSLKIALDELFNHANTGPFIGRQLIQRLVTSNPSPAYVTRVSRAFGNNGAGLRGDMKAVLRAVLLDPEARDPARVNDVQWGKLREPMVRFANFMRAFDARPNSTQDGKYAIWNLEDPVSSLGQNPMRAPSVFNWFRPTYAPPGEVAARGLVAPEFQILHETTATGYANFVVQLAQYGHGFGNIPPNYNAELALASNPAALLDRLNLLLTNGRMTSTTRQTILAAVQAMPAGNARGRVQTAIALTMLSPDFIVQK